MAGERGNEEAKKKKEWNDGDATLHSMPASRILPHLGENCLCIAELKRAEGVCLRAHVTTL